MSLKYIPNVAKMVSFIFYVGASGKEPARQCRSHRRHKFDPCIREDSPGEGEDSPRQYSCLENPMDRGVWWATVHRVTKRHNSSDLLLLLLLSHVSRVRLCATP